MYTKKIVGIRAFNSDDGYDSEISVADNSELDVEWDDIYISTVSVDGK